jgi:hypothetical protein
MRDDRVPGPFVPCSLLPAGMDHVQTDGARPDYRNPALPTARRVEDPVVRPR